MHVLSIILPLYLALPTTAGSLKPRATYTDCTDSQKQLLSAAVTDAGKMASAGASSLRSNSASSLFQTFFKTTDSSAMDQVASALEKIAEEASQPGGGVVTYSCSPGSINCQSGGFTTTGYASTDGTNGQVNTCPAYFDLPASSDDCTVLDQRTSALHELGHTKGVLGNEVYGYQEIMNIDTQTALSNAESYAFFAKSVFLGCGGQSGQSGKSGQSGQSSQSGQTGKTGSSGSNSGGSSSTPKTSGTTSSNNPSGSNQKGSSSPLGGSSNTGSLGNLGSLFGNSGSLTGPGSSMESSSPYGSSGSPYGSSYGSPYGSSGSLTGPGSSMESSSPYGSSGSPYGSSDSPTGSGSPMESSMDSPYGGSSGMGSLFGSENSMGEQGSSMESPPSVIDSGSQDSYGGMGNSDSYGGSDSYGDMGSSGSYDDMGSSDSYGGMGY